MEIKITTDKKDIEKIENMRAMQWYEIRKEYFSNITLEKMKEDIAAKNSRFFSPREYIAAVEKNQILGFAVLLVEEWPNSRKKGYIEDLYVPKENRLKGIATSLVNFSTDFLKKTKKCDTVCVECAARDYGALNFYKTMGFDSINYIALSKTKKSSDEKIKINGIEFNF